MTKPLSESQSLALDLYEAEIARLSAWKLRFLKHALQELGGKLTEPWQFDDVNRVFFLNETATGPQQ